MFFRPGTTDLRLYSKFLNYFTMVHCTYRGVKNSTLTDSFKKMCKYMYVPQKIRFINVFLLCPIWTNVGLKSVEAPSANCVVTQLTNILRNFIIWKSMTVLYNTLYVPANAIETFIVIYFCRLNIKYHFTMDVQN